MVFEPLCVDYVVGLNLEVDIGIAVHCMWGLSKKISSVVFIVYNFYFRACSDPRLICKRSALTLRKPG